MLKQLKGKGFSYAEQDKLGTWHGVGKFNKETEKFSRHKRKIKCLGVI